MSSYADHPKLHRRLTDSLYLEAMLLADEARAYFDEVGRAERDLLDPAVRVGFSCESLKVTTRLMHVIAWLLTRRALEAGELAPSEVLHSSRRLGDAPASDVDLLHALPPRAQSLIAASEDLHRRAARLDTAQDVVSVVSPARSMLERLKHSF